FLKLKFKEYINVDTVRIYQGLDNLAQIMYFAKLVITGGGTIVRESALLGVPSIEFFPLETYPQEQFLMDNGFPLKHFHLAKDSVNQAIKYLESDYRIDTFEKIRKLDNPIEISITKFEERISKS
ncbi:MAG: DUF354 domain-containing protein, partial [Candidatus Lokiarchaeota archaeon]|nr:DUF354 domain-containing protein [Candidatus Lokiarchaeota archaeon]